MNHYSQNNEDQVILDYFSKAESSDTTFSRGLTPGHLLDIGANDGKTFSNSRLLIEHGWTADLIEPAPSAFEKLHELYQDNPNVGIYPIAVGPHNGYTILHESGAHVPNGTDIALVSSTINSETEKWRQAGVEFRPVFVPVMNIDMFYHFRSSSTDKVYRFISIDCEGMDLVILKQLDLSRVECICIEWNLNEQVKADALKYCGQFGLNTILSTSAENLIIAR